MFRLWYLGFMNRFFRYRFGLYRKVEKLWKNSVKFMVWLLIFVSIVL